MNKYIIGIQEVFEKHIEIEANNVEDAMAEARASYDSKKIVLDDKDLISVDIKLLVAKYPK